MYPVLCRGVHTCTQRTEKTGPRAQAELPKEGKHGRHRRRDNNVDLWLEFQRNFRQKYACPPPSKPTRNTDYSSTHYSGRPKGTQNGHLWSDSQREFGQKWPCARPQRYRTGPPNLVKSVRNEQKRVKHTFRCKSNGFVHKSGLRMYRSRTYREIPRFQHGISLSEKGWVPVKVVFGDENRLRT